MDRRNFFKIVGTASGGAVTGACGKQATEIIPLLVPEEEIVPGVESWRPAVCGECGAGCRMRARVMAAEREIDHEGGRVRQRIAAVKKLEGDPADPVSGGRLCARGHAALQGLYNPDRVRGPLKRSGRRGEGQFEPVSWEAALEAVAEAVAAQLSADPAKILFLSPPVAGTKAANVARFLEALGAPPARAVGFGDHAAELEASRRCFGWDGPPVYEIQDSTMALSIGADFLGSWLSPVLYSRRYGHMRQGRRGRRGRLVHAEARFSTTAWNADEWLPVLPGGELALALGIGRALLAELPAERVGKVPTPARRTFSQVDLQQAAESSGITAATMRAAAAELAAADAPVVIAGASMVRPNSADAVTAACAINLLLGNVGRPGGIRPPLSSGTGLEAHRPASAGWLERLAEARVVLLDRANPVYGTPSAAGALADSEVVVSFSPFLDDSSCLADFVLPDHSDLERGGILLPATAPARSLAATEPSFSPLHDSRATDEVLSSLAEALGRPFAALDARTALRRLGERVGTADDRGAAFASEALRQGGWSGSGQDLLPLASPRLDGLAAWGRPDGVLLQCYPSLQFGHGAGANRPWLQELPDPASSAMWGLPVELDPGTAERLGLTNGDPVVIESAHGSLRAPAYIHPAALPGVLSMALGQGHAHFGRYASGRGANPMRLVGPARDERTGATATGPVAVTLRKAAGEGGLIQFSHQDREAPPHRT